MLVEDDQYIAAKTVSAYNKLVHSRGVRILFVLTYGGLSAIAPRAEQDGVFLIDTLDADEGTAKLPPNTFCIAKRTEDLGVELARQIRGSEDFPSAVVYFDGDPFMGILTRAMLAELEKHGQRAEIVETYNNDTSEFRGVATRIKSRDVKAVALLGYDQLGLAARTLRDLGSSAQLYGVATATSPGFRNIAGVAVEGMKGAVFRANPSTELERFQGRFIARVGRPWQFEASTIHSYDGMQLLAQALSTPGAITVSTAAPRQREAEVRIDKVREGLLAIRGYAGLSGVITIDPDGITRSIPVTSAIFRSDGTISFDSVTERKTG